jgi:anti-anti-sigma factor
VLYAAGELDIDTAAGLRRTLADAGRDPDRDVVVDLSGVTFVDCAGLRPLLEARTRLRERLWLRSPPRPVTLLLGHTGLLDTFQILGTASTRSAAPAPAVPPVVRDGAGHVSSRAEDALPSVRS